MHTVSEKLRVSKYLQTSIIRRPSMNMPDPLRNVLMILTPIILMILISVISVLLDIDISSIPRIILIPGFFILELFVLYLLEQ